MSLVVRRDRSKSRIARGLYAGWVSGVLILSFCVGGCSSSSSSSRVMPTREEIALAHEEVKKGAAALRADNFDSSFMFFSRALELAPLSSAFDGIGCVYFRRGEIREATRYYTEAINRDPHNGRAYGHLALLYDYEGQIDKAEITYRKGIALAPDDYDTRFNFAIFLADRQRGDPGEASSQLWLAKSLLNSDSGVGSGDMGLVYE